MRDALDKLRNIPDPADRARSASALIDDIGTMTGEASQIRREALSHMLASGQTKTEIARATAMTPQRVSQILQGGPGPERAFWGADSGKLTVAVGEKLEAPKAGAGPAGPVVATWDFAAFDMLKDAVRPLGIEACREVIQPPGIVKLNRPGLVVICGPRLSPLVAEVLESDQSLGFGHDDAGWHLLDKRAGTVYPSPMDTGENADIAYLGRLPRLDGRGTFIYVAGIHAPGAPGVIHYLADELEQVWQQVRDRRFSTLIRSTFDPVTRMIISSERITDFYRPEGN